LRKVKCKVKRDGWTGLLRSVKVNLFWQLERQILFHFTPLLRLCFRKPRFIYVEPTNDCNLRCEMCLRGGGREVGYMNMNLYRRVVDEAAGIGGVSLKLLFAGEPALHPHFAEMVTYAVAKKHRFYKLELISNGMLWNRKIMEAALGLDCVTFSVDGVGSVYERIRKGGNYAVVQRNIRKFLEMRGGRASPIVSINTVLTSQTDADLKALRDEWVPLGVNMNVSGCIDSSFRFVNAERYRACNRRGYMEHCDPVCHMPFTSLIVLYDGAVGFCCHDLKAEAVVSKFKWGLMNIWRWSGKLQSARRGLHKICLKCGQKESLRSNGANVGCGFGIVPAEGQRGSRGP